MNSTDISIPTDKHDCYYFYVVFHNFIPEPQEQFSAELQKAFDEGMAGHYYIHAYTDHYVIVEFRRDLSDDLSIFEEMNRPPNRKTALAQFKHELEELTHFAYIVTRGPYAQPITEHFKTN